MGSRELKKEIVLYLGAQRRLVHVPHRKVLLPHNNERLKENEKYTKKIKDTMMLKMRMTMMND